MTHLDFPFHFDGRERTAETGRADFIRDLIEQILFTNPGERVNRPDFGAGILQLVFAPASTEAAATAEFMIRGALQQNLGHLIAIETVETVAQDATMRITIAYQILRTGTSEEAEFMIGVGP
ncbi:GPW/gp25 family protein [Rhodobacteraceae bacterium B1Z28]|uniref:GPW/gp25 family protein n=1 Tax=Ruegeria haliotis TaxID=2747601 RepID=A0ABX2PX86_9RHOB|nr:GPW/gp25 family protein [Ruegeria haliotis]NVO58261.1 GPW/gp25 family protein [Ruegeria haliotis]